MTRWYESTDHMEDRAVRLQERLGPEALARFSPLLDGFDAEARFTELVQQYVRPDDVVVDIATGDGEWLLTKVAPLARFAIGFDYAARRLWLALQRRRALGLTNAELLLADGRRIPLRDAAANAIINRRGPWTADETFFIEGCRVLAEDGLALEITIGEQNATQIEDVFGERDQLREWVSRGFSRLEALYELYQRHGLEMLVAESHVATEVFPSREALIYRLESAPIVVDFDAEADRPLVDQVIARHGGPDGIPLTMHRLCLVARKTA